MAVRTEFKTKGGLTLPLLNLKGKEYLMAAHRIAWLENENPFYSIKNEIIHHEPDVSATCRTTITIYDENGKQKRQVDAIKTEHKRSFDDYLEKAQTGACARAASYIGYGTQFSGDELNEIVNEKGIEVNRLADAPIVPAQPVAKPVAEVKRGFTPKDTSVKKEAWE